MTLNGNKMFQDEPPYPEDDTSDPQHRMMPGCTKNPLETQETLQTFGMSFANASNAKAEFMREQSKGKKSVIYYYYIIYILLFIM